MPQALNNANATLRNWREVETRATGTIALSRGLVAYSRCQAFIFGPQAAQRTAFQLRKFLHEECTTTKNQAIQNIYSQIDSLNYIDGKNWESHIDKLNSLLAKLANHGE